MNMRIPIVGLLASTISFACIRVRSIEDEAQPVAQGDREEIATARNPAVAQHEREPAARGSSHPPIELGEPVTRIEPGVELHAAGDEPRMALRLRPFVGARQRTTLRMDMVMAMDIGSQSIGPRAIPSIETTIESEVLFVEDDEIHYRISALEAKAYEQEDASPRVRQAVSQAIASLRETRGTVVVSGRGRTMSIDLQVSDENDPGLRPTLESFRQSFNQMFVWLPEASVGKGARWTATSHVAHAGIEIQQRTEYRVVGIDADRVELAFDLEQHSMQEGAVPGGALAVDAHAARGSGRVELDLRHVLPLSGTATSAGATRSRLALGGAPEAVLMKLDLDLALRSPSTSGRTSSVDVGR